MLAQSPAQVPVKYVSVQCKGGGLINRTLRQFDFIARLTQQTSDSGSVDGLWNQTAIPTVVNNYYDALTSQHSTFVDIAQE